MLRRLAQTKEVQHEIPSVGLQTEAKLVHRRVPMKNATVNKTTAFRRRMPAFVE
jgi:hypothetical protein